MNNQPNLIKLITEIHGPAYVALDDVVSIAATFGIAAIIGINVYALYYLYNQFQANTTNTNNPNSVDPERAANDQTNDIPLQDMNTEPEPPVNSREVLNRTNFTTNTLETQEERAQRVWEAFQQHYM